MERGRGQTGRQIGGQTGSGFVPEREGLERGRQVWGFCGPGFVLEEELEREREHGCVIVDMFKILGGHYTLCVDNAFGLFLVSFNSFWNDFVRPKLFMCMSGLIGHGLL